MRSFLTNKWLLLMLIIAVGFFGVKYGGSFVHATLSQSGRFYHFTPQEAEANFTVVKGKYSVASCAGRGSFPALSHELRAVSGSVKFRAYQYPARKGETGAYLYSEAMLLENPSLRAANTLTQFQRGNRFRLFTVNRELAFKCGIGFRLKPGEWWLPELGDQGPKDRPSNLGMMSLTELPEGKHLLVWTEGLSSAGEPSREGVYASVHAASGWSEIFKLHETTPGMVAGAPLTSTQRIRDLKTVADGSTVLVAWSERAEWNTSQSIYHAAAAIYAQVIDVSSLQVGSKHQIWAAERTGGNLIGIQDNAPEQDLLLHAKPFNIVWGERGEFKGKFGEGVIPNYVFSLHTATLRDGQWSDHIFAQGEIIDMLLQHDGSGEPYLFWSYWPTGQSSCQNRVTPLHMSTRIYDSGKGYNEWVDAVSLPDADWFGLKFAANASRRGVLAYVVHCERGGYASDNTLTIRKLQGGILGPPQMLEYVDTPGYRGWGEVTVVEQSPNVFRIDWTAQNIWAPKQYTVTVP